MAFLVLMAGCVHSKAPGWQQVEAPLAEETGRFRVLSLNIAHGVRQPLVGFLVEREAIDRNLHALSEALAREDADVVGLQEVHVYGADPAEQLHHLRTLADGAGYTHRFYGNHYVPVRDDLQKGTALLARTELHGPLSQAFAVADGDDHGWVKATLRPEGLGGIEVDVVNLHLDPYSAARRVAQMEALAEAFADRARPLIVMGDFNSDWAGRDGVRQLAEALGLEAYRPHDGPRTYPSTLPIQRLDWILVSPELRILRYRTFVEPATDHRGIVAELGLSPGAWIARKGRRARLQLAARQQEVRGTLLATRSPDAPVSAPPTGGAGRPLAAIAPESPPMAPPGHLTVAPPAPKAPSLALAQGPSSMGPRRPDEGAPSASSDVEHPSPAPSGFVPPDAPSPLSASAGPVVDPLAIFLDWFAEASGNASGEALFRFLQGPPLQGPATGFW